MRVTWKAPATRLAGPWRWDDGAEKGEDIEFLGVVPFTHPGVVELRVEEPAKDGWELVLECEVEGWRHAVARARFVSGAAQLSWKVGTFPLRGMTGGVRLYRLSAWAWQPDGDQLEEEGDRVAEVVTTLGNPRGIWTLDDEKDELHHHPWLRALRVAALAAPGARTSEQATVSIARSIWNGLLRPSDRRRRRIRYGGDDFDPVNGGPIWDLQKFLDDFEAGEALPLAMACDGCAALTSLLASLLGANANITKVQGFLPDNPPPPLALRSHIRIGGWSTAPDDPYPYHFLVDLGNDRVVDPSIVLRGRRTGHAGSFDAWIASSLRLPHPRPPNFQIVRSPPSPAFPLRTDWPTRAARRRRLPLEAIPQPVRSRLDDLVGRASVLLGVPDACWRATGGTEQDWRVVAFIRGAHGQVWVDAAPPGSPIRARGVVTAEESGVFRAYGTPDVVRGLGLG